MSVRSEFRPHTDHPPHRCSAKGCTVYAEWEQTRYYSPGTEDEDSDDWFYCNEHKEYFEKVQAGR